jgi:pre-rRNA-processing protein TSR1
MLDAAKVADFLLLLQSPSEGIDNYGEYCLSCLFAQGLPACVHAVHGLNGLPVKKHTEIKKLLQKCIEKRCVVFDILYLHMYLIPLLLCRETD